VDYASYSQAAKADVYGSLFFYLRSLLLKFGKCLSNANVSIHLYSVDAKDLRDFLPQNMRAFDRSEVSLKKNDAPLTTHSLFSP
jgi:hypothetical protein